MNSLQHNGKMIGRSIVMKFVGALATALVCCAQMTALAQDFRRVGDGSLHIYSGDNQNRYLGCFDCRPNSPYSIFNPSSYFHEQLVSPFNPYGRTTFGDLSMCSSFANSAPMLVVAIPGQDYSQPVGRLSLNEFGNGSVCNAMASSYSYTSCARLKTFCSSTN